MSSNTPPICGPPTRVSHCAGSALDVPTTSPPPHPCMISTVSVQTSTFRTSSTINTQAVVGRARNALSSSIVAPWFWATRSSWGLMVSPLDPSMRMWTTRLPFPRYLPTSAWRTWLTVVDFPIPISPLTMRVTTASPSLAAIASWQISSTVSSRPTKARSGSITSRCPNPSQSSSPRSTLSSTSNSANAERGTPKPRCSPHRTNDANRPSTSSSAKPPDSGQHSFARFSSSSKSGRCVLGSMFSRMRLRVTERLRAASSLSVVRSRWVGHMSEASESNTRSWNEPGRVASSIWSSSCEGICPEIASSAATRSVLVG